MSTLSSDPQHSSEHAAVHATISTYLQGHASASASLMRDAFLPTAHVEGNRQGTFTSWGLEEYCDAFKGMPAADEPACIRSIDWIDIAGDAAAAKATLIHGNVTFTDYFVLIKVSDQWKIANKVYYADRK